MNLNQALRPLERRVVQLVEDGIGTTEIARRFRRSPEMIERIVGLATLPGRAAASAISQSEVLRPLERRVLRWREMGADYTEIASRFRRSPEDVEQVEKLARYKLDNA
jgi:DNA-binding CsgD family transcriptional regulator